MMVSQDFVLGLPKGRLLQHSIAIAESLGIDFGCSLSCRSSDWPLSLLLLKAADIPRLVDCGTLDCGIAPAEWIDEYLGKKSMKALSFARIEIAPWVNTRLCFFGSKGQDWPPPRGAQVATSFPKLAASALAKMRISMRILSMTGSVEAVVPALTPYGFDLVETGETLRQNSLEILHVANSNLGMAFLVQKNGRNLSMVFDVLLNSIKSYLPHCLSVP